jgi:rhodanese-related sulfurtransferase
MQSIDVHELKRRMDAGESFRLIDVREADEWAFCRLPRAEWLPLSTFAQDALERLRPEESIVLYCHHGIRSLHAGQFLEQHGFRAITNLTGGIHAWSKHIDSSVPVY